MRDRPAEHDERDEREARLGALTMALEAHGFVVTAETPLERYVARNAPHAVRVPIHCTSRASDGGRLWFLGPDDKPLGPADQIHEALTELKGLTAADERTVHLRALMDKLREAGINADMTGDFLLRTSSQRTPDNETYLSCQPRREFGGALWFMTSGGAAIVPVKYLGRAVAKVRELNAVRL